MKSGFDLLIRGMTQTLLEGEEQRRIKGLMCSEQHRWLHLPCDRDTTTHVSMFYETPQRSSQSLGGLQAYIIPSRLCMHGMKYFWTFQMGHLDENLVLKINCVVSLRLNRARTGMHVFKRSNNAQLSLWNHQSDIKHDFFLCKRRFIEPLYSNIHWFSPVVPYWQPPGLHRTYYTVMQQHHMYDLRAWMGLEL